MKFIKIPFYILLIPIFFVEHGVLENFGFIGIEDALLLIGIYCFSTLLLFILFFLFFKKNSSKAGLATAYLMTCYLFYGALQDFLKTHVHWLAKYAVLLPLLIIIFILLIRYLKKVTNLAYKLTFLINILFIVYIFLDTFLLIKTVLYRPENGLSIYAPANKPLETVNDTIARPDIYFLLFDEYASSLSLKEHYNFSNNLDSFLLNRGFHIQSKSYSNYPFTPASMASILNMSYLKNVNTNTGLTVKGMNECASLIKDNEVIKFLSKQCYEIVNCSIFDLAGNPSPVNQTLLPLKTRLITDNTLLSRINRDLSWMLFRNKYGTKWLIRKRIYGIVANNANLLAATEAQANYSSDKPRFIYAHLYMPHAPFFYDRNGKLRDEIAVAPEMKRKEPAKEYLEYLLYTNKKIEQLIETIQYNTKEKAVIILMGDHGFRLYAKDLLENYQNMNAVYFPDKNYSLFYDSISGVNQFRVVFNSLFHQSFPMLKDSTIFLQDK